MTNSMSVSRSVSDSPSATLTKKRVSEREKQMKEHL